MSETIMSLVVTTINHPTRGIRQLAQQASKLGVKFIVIGDLKTPENFEVNSVEFISKDLQAKINSPLSDSLPWNRYSRKMLGYVRAIQLGSKFIIETDDDNLPYENFIQIPTKEITSRDGKGDQSEWLNCYKYFTDRHIWPRGFPLNLCRENVLGLEQNQFVTIQHPYIVQALADGDPDVDAVWRLTNEDVSEVRFRQDTPISPSATQYCPFNSQATTWPRELFLLMYLPSTCSFRMTDIWRSLIAQRIMRELNSRVVFVAPRVFQERNAHNLMNDFQLEVEGYLGYERMVNVLDSIHLEEDFLNISDNLMAVYERLVTEGFFSKEEEETLAQWIIQIESITATQSTG